VQNEREEWRARPTKHGKENTRSRKARSPKQRQEKINIKSKLKINIAQTA